MSQRPTFRPYSEYQQQQRNILAHKDEFGPRLFRQMVVGFVCAGLLGVVLLTLGASFMKDALKSEYSISVMLCVFGMGKSLKFVKLTADVLLVCALYILLINMFIGNMSKITKPHNIGLLSVKIYNHNKKDKNSDN